MKFELIPLYTEQGSEAIMIRVSALQGHEGEERQADQ